MKLENLIKENINLAGFALAWGLAVFVVTGCSTISSIENAQITATQIAVLGNSFDGAKATATTYISLPDCLAGQTFLKNVCADPAAEAKIIPAIRAGTAARNSLEKSVAGTGTATAFGSAVSASIATINATLAQYKGV